jgi:4-hydroxythreonine-4-phosphate dehydrogenase
MRTIVSVGDPSGIGPELFAQLILDEPQWLERGDFILTGPPRLWRQLGLEEGPNLQFQGSPFEGTLPTPGIPCAKGAEIQCRGFLEALEIVQEDESASLLTLPVNKEQLNKAGITFLGHTEYFRIAYPSRKITMAFRSDAYWLALVTDHLALQDVPERLHEEDLIKSATQLYEASQKPLAICGLNPHAGEAGLMGDDELRLAPALVQIRSKGIPCRGFIAADSFFAHWDPKEAVLALYHDQGLSPFKALFHGQSCQISLGMPFRRVSPDHGTAYSLAGTGKADPGSLRQALKEALR